MPSVFDMIVFSTNGLLSLHNCSLLTRFDYIKLHSFLHVCEVCFDVIVVRKCITGAYCQDLEIYEVHKWFQGNQIW